METAATIPFNQLGEEYRHYFLLGMWEAFAKQVKVHTEIPIEAARFFLDTFHTCMVPNAEPVPAEVEDAPMDAGHKWLNAHMGDLRREWCLA